MQTDRHAIITLVALGRISPAEAERLLLACNSGRDSVWIAGLCLTAVWLTQLNIHGWLLGESQLIHELPALLERAWSLIRLLWEGH